MIKNLYCSFCTKTKYPFILNYRGVGKGEDERSRSKWNQGKVIEIS